MAGHQTQSADTRPEVEEKIFDRWRALEPWQKVDEMASLTRGTRELAALGVRSRYPDASESEVRLRVAARCYERELMIRAYGWDPEVMGY